MADNVRASTLACGVLAALFFVGIDVLASSSWREYNFISRSIGELIAIGAPTRPFALPLFIIQDLLLLVFGVGIWASAGDNVALRATGVLLTLYSAAWIVAAFFPARVGEVPHALSIGVLLGAAAIILMLVAIASGAAAFGNWFRTFSIGVLATFALLTILGLAQSTPRVGLQERVMTYVFLTWAAVLSVVLLIHRDAVAGGLGANAS